VLYQITVVLHFIVTKLLQKLKTSLLDRIKFITF